MTLRAILIPTVTHSGFERAMPKEIKTGWPRVMRWGKLKPMAMHSDLHSGRPKPTVTHLDWLREISTVMATHLGSPMDSNLEIYLAKPMETHSDYRMGWHSGIYLVKRTEKPIHSEAGTPYPEYREIQYLWYP